MSKRVRAAPPTRGWRRLRHHLPQIMAGLAAVAVAATATLAGVRLLRGDEPRLVEPAQAPAPVTASASPGASPAGESAAPAPSASPGRARARPRATLAAVPIPRGRAAASPYDELARQLAVGQRSGVAVYVDRYLTPGPMRVVDSSGVVRDFTIGPAGTSPVAAAVAPDETWIAAVDGSGVLWRVELSGEPPFVLSSGSDGLVFGVRISFMPDGRLLTTQVGSVSVPMPSRVVTVDPASGEVTVVADDATAYQPTPLSDGSFAYFTSNADGSTVVHRRAGGRETSAVELGQTASVDVSPDGRHVAVERAGRTLELVSLPGGESRRIGTGSQPRFAPSGDRLSALDLDRGVALELDLSGRQISATRSLHVAWVECPKGCAP